nr:ABC transporter substrate-binding protein [Deinobacterium chartae]
MATGLLVGLLTACSSGGGGERNTLTTVTFGDWSSFDPAYCYDSACGEVLQNTLDTLFFYDGDSPRDLVPQLAAELPTVENGGISEDGRVYRVRLREGAKFSDGSPITPEDVEYSLERMMVYSTDVGPAGLLLEPLLGSAAPVRADGEVGYEAIDKAIEVEGDTVVFTLAKPFAPFLEVLAGYWGSIYSKSAAVEAGDWSGTANDWEEFNNLEQAESKLNGGPLGSGPFTIERYDVGTSVILQRNNNYYKEPAQLERVIILSVNEEGTRIQQLQAGDADMASPNAITPSQLPTVRKIEGVTVEQRPSLSLTAFLMNWNIDGSGTGYLGSGRLDGRGIPANFFSDENVRRGIAYAFDYDAYVNDVLQGNGRQQNTILLEGLPGADESQRYSQDLDRAREAFQAAWNGEVWENGFTLPVFFNSGNTSRQRGLEILKQNLESLNPKFRVEVRELQFSQILSQGAAGKMTLWFAGWGADFADPHSFAQPFYESHGTYAQNIRYSDPAMDRLISEAIASTNQDRRVELYRQIATRGFEEVVMVPLTQSLNTYVTRDNVQGRVMNPMFAGDYFYPISKQ